LLNRFLSKDFLAGLMFFGFGLLTYVVAFTNLSSFFGQTRLPLGTPVRMGPGYVPQMLAFVMMTLGAIIALWSIRDLMASGALKLARLVAGSGSGRARIEGYLEAVRTGVEPPEPVEGLMLRPILMITLGVLAFGMLLEPGNLPGVVSWFVSGLPRWENPISGLLPALVALVFLAALGGNEFHVLETVGMCIVLFILCLLIFKCGLSMNITMFGVFPALGDQACGRRPMAGLAVLIALTTAGWQWYRRRRRSHGDTPRGAV
jgi:hypothetical protein